MKLIPYEKHLADLRCKKCDSFVMHLSEQTFNNGATHIKATCAICTSYVAYVRQFDPNEDKPGDWIFPFGKYKGKPLNDLLSIDPGYLYWVTENVAGKPKDKCKEFLDSVDSSRDFRS